MRLGTDFEDDTVNGYARIRDLDVATWRGWVLLESAENWNAGEVIVTVLSGPRAGDQARAIIDDSTRRAVALTGLSAFTRTETSTGRRGRRK